MAISWLSRLLAKKWAKAEQFSGGLKQSGLFGRFHK